MQSKRTLSIFPIILLLILTACGSVEVGESQTDTLNIELQDEKALKVNITQGLGNLSVSGETEKGAEVGFTYNVEKLKPALDYKISDESIGQLTIIQSSMNVPMGNIEGIKYSGNVLLNKKLPTDLYIKAGAGINSIDLQDLNLKKVEILPSVGQTTINLNGNYKQDFDVNIEAGMGTTKIIIPKNVGVHVFADNAIGKIETEGLKARDKTTFVNHSYGKSEVTINMKIKMGVGDVVIIEGASN